jgi:YgiT-type zinc finger domain-containing protein
MKCVFCKEGQTRSRRVTVERHNQAGEPIAVIHNFPADVCENCGEEYYAAEDWTRVDQLQAQAPARVAEVRVYELEAP